MRYKILMLVQLPPPVHGVSAMNSIVVRSKLINDLFLIDVLPVNSAAKLTAVGTLSLKKIFSIPLFILRLFGKLIAEKPDLVYFTICPTGLAFFRDCVYVVILKLFNVKILYHLHGKGMQENLQKSHILKCAYKYVFRNTEVIHLSNGLLTDLDGLHTGKKHVVPNCVAFDATNLKTSRRQGSVRFIFLSNLVIAKGIVVFLEALAILKSKDIPFEAVIVGSSSKSFSIEDAKRFISHKDLSNEVSVLGPMYGRDKFFQLASSSVFVLPSRNECFPLSMLEAMLCGNVIITTKQGAIPEVIEEGVNGMLLETLDARELSEKMSYLVDNPDELEAMSANNLIKMSKNYTVEGFEQNMLRVFKDAMKK